MPLSKVTQCSFLSIITYVKINFMKICDLKRYITLNLAAYLSLYLLFEIAVLFFDFFGYISSDFSNRVCDIGLLILFFIPFCLLVLFPLELLIAFLLKKWFPNKFKKTDDKKTKYDIFFTVLVLFSCFFMFFSFIIFYSILIM